MPSAPPESRRPRRPSGIGRVARILLAITAATPCLDAATVLVRLGQDPGAQRSGPGDVLAALPAGLLHNQRPLYRNSHDHSLAWHCLETDRPGVLITELSGRPGVLAVQANGRLAVMQADGGVGDSLRAQQWGLDEVGAEQAWQGGSTGQGIVVAVIDTGVEPGHPDLRSQWAINFGEDLDGDGVLEPDGAGGWRLDPDDLDGQDTDGNGFIDDLLGWDFTDAPDFPAPGDYLGPDNQPWDEHGHGTAVTGILGAARNNRVGITGLAPGCRILPLRAATSAGWLEEDDVAAAVLYAVENGARVLNLSFGDTAYGPMLADVLAWAETRGVLVVASSGNSGDATPHWPSGLPTVLSVGSARRLPNAPFVERAGSSGYGAGLDLLAPGVEIMSTALGGGWRTVSGTSAAAPFASAACALLLGREPELAPAVVRARLLESARDLETSGWDETTGAGLLDAAALLELPDAPRLEVVFPWPGAVVSRDALLARGIVCSAWGAGFREARLSVGPQRTSARLLASTTEPWYLDTLRGWPTDWLEEDTDLILRLELEDGGGQLDVRQASFRLDDSPARVLQWQLAPAIEGDTQALRLELELDEPAGVEVLLDTGARFTSTLRTRGHVVVLRAAAGSGAGITVTLVNAAGLPTQQDLGEWTWPPVSVPAAREDIGTTLPAGIWLGQAGDWDHDGLTETLVAPWETGREVPGPTRAWRLDPSGWQPTGPVYGELLPKGVGDTDGDGRPEFLLGISGRCELWEAASQGLPDHRVWHEDTQWAAAVVNLPALWPRDLLLLQTDDSERRHSLWTVAADPAGDRDPAPEHLLDLPSPWADEPRLQGPPSGTPADTDGADGEELWLSDRSGHLFGYAFRNGQAQLLDTLSFAGWIGPGHWLCRVARVVGPDHLALLLHSPVTTTESAAGGEVWRLLLLGRPEPGHALEVLDSLEFLGVHDGQGQANALATWRPEGMDTELALLLAPRAYSVALTPDGDRFAGVRQTGEGFSGGALLALDHDGNGSEELLLPLQAEGAAESREWHTAAASGPLPPLWSTDSGPLDSRRIRLVWSYPAAPPDSATVYVAGDPAIRAGLPGTVTQWVDSTLADGETRSYRLGSHTGGQEGPLSPLRTFTAGVAPILLSWQESDPLTLELEFDRGLQAASLESGLRITDSGGDSITPTSLLLLESGRRLRIGLPPVEEAGTWQASLHGLRGWNGTPLDSLVLEWEHQSPAAPPLALIRARVLPGHRVLLEFSAELDAATSQPGFRFEPGLCSIREWSIDGTTICLSLEPCSLLESGASPFMIFTSGLLALDGRLPQGGADRIQVQAPLHWLEDLVVYPNPWRGNLSGGSGTEGIRFEGLPRGSQVRIFDLGGRRLVELDLPPGETWGSVLWNLQDAQGGTVPSGTYLYRIDHEQSGTRQGKVAVIR